MPLLILFILSCFAQDERVLREIYDPSLYGRPQKRYNWKVRSPFYNYDLTGNGQEEIFLIEYKDNLAFLRVFSRLLRLQTEVTMASKYEKGQVRKIRIHSLDKTHRLIMIYFDEGRPLAKEVWHNHRLYFLLYNQKRWNFTKGPIYAYSHTNLKGRYIQRIYEVIIEDLVDSPTKEVLLKHGSSFKVYQVINSKMKRRNKMYEANIDL